MFRSELVKDWITGSSSASACSPVGSLTTCQAVIQLRARGAALARRTLNLTILLSFVSSYTTSTIETSSTTSLLSDAQLTSMGAGLRTDVWFSHSSER